MEYLPDVPDSLAYTQSWDSELYCLDNLLAIFCQKDQNGNRFQLMDRCPTFPNGLLESIARPTIGVLPSFIPAESAVEPLIQNTGFGTEVEHIIL